MSAGPRARTDSMGSPRAQLPNDAADREERAWVVWLSGGSCEGCTMSVLGATSPRLEELLGGGLTHIPRVELIHSVLSFDAGDRFVSSLEDARTGILDPFILVLEGSLFDTARAGEGSFSGLGTRNGSPISIEEWVAELVPRAAAVIAIGTCATSGGVPAGAGNVTGAMGIGDFLGEEFRSRGGLPVINVPGCAPSGDAFVELMSYVLLHLGGLVPLDLDDEGRPRWLYRDTTDVGPPAVPGAVAPDGPGLTAQCNVPSRGWINNLGGCRPVGGSCNGCTRPDFPDRTLPLALVRRG